MLARRSSIVLAMLLALLCATPSQAAEDVVIQGTTDIRDAGLLDDVIVPGFEAAYPQYNLQYIAVGTGQALTNARNGQGDAVLTHAAPLEAQFVADGYSAEPYGRAIFYSDYVILGPQSDPAGVLSGAAHNAAHALELIAAAGGSGTANFVSRGDNSGTNVAEEQIWNRTTGVTLCDVATGRKRPYSQTGPCTGGTEQGWYHRAGLGQAQTVQLADQCPFSGGNCYEMTDRGTFNRLVSTGAITNLKVVSDRNDAAAPGGKDLLVNSFHAYAVNPAKFSPGTIDQTGATAFLDFLTSRDFQSRLASYPNQSDPAFFASAAPTITGSLPAEVTAGQPLTISGSVSNNTPGTPALGSVGVQLFATGPSLGDPGAVASTTTAADGSYSLGFSPVRSGLYSLQTPQITETVIPGTPPFGDILQPGNLTLGNVTVRSTITLDSAKAKPGKVRVKGEIAPDSGRSDPKLILLGKRKGGKGKPGFRKLGSAGLGQTGSGFNKRFDVRPGRYRVQVRYSDLGIVESATSDALRVKVPKD